MSVAYRDREQSRFDDSKSAVSGRSNATKVTRYIVKEDDTRTDYGRASRAEPRQSRSNYIASRFDDSKSNYDRADSRYDETRTIHISRTEDEPQREYSRAKSTAEPSKYTRETITIRRNEDDERDEYWRRPSGEDVGDRELVIRRDTERDIGRDARASVALSRIDDRRDTEVVAKFDERRYTDYEVVSPQRRDVDDREVSRYVRTSEHYYPQQQSQPQTIIIRQEPIIIRERERPREEDFQIVKKSDIDEERSVARRSERPEPRDEEYFYEKRVRERIPEDDRKSRLRREVSPGDSVSQAGRGRYSRRGSESDDSMVYVRKEKITEYGSRDSSGHRGRDMAAGALAGVGAAELFRNHNEKEGKETSSGMGRVARDAGAGVIGAVAAEGLRRYRSKSRRRSRSSSSGRKSRHRRSRSRSRSSSNNRFGNLGGNMGGLGLAAVAVAAGAFIASKKKKEASPERRSRSRSRRRSASRGRSVSSSRLSYLENDPNADDARNPKHRNSRTAAAGAIGAAAAAMLERHKSKSRGRAHSESPNRIKQGLPIVVAGLGTAGLAHLYEKNKAKQGAEEIVRDEDRRSRSRSARPRSRTRASSAYGYAPRQPSYSDPSLVQYGNEPLNGNNYGEGYYGTRATEPDYYNNSNRAMVPAPAPPPAVSSFDARASRPRSASRTRSESSGRSRSRSRGAAAAATAAGAGVAASAYDQNRKDKKERRRRHSSRGSSRRGTFDSRASVDPYNGRDPYEDANWHATHSASYAQGMNDPYGSQAGFYPPPPGPMPQQGYAPQQSYTPQPAYAPTPQPQGTYGPQDFPPPPPNAPQAQQQQFNPYAPNQNPYAPRSRGADDYVSAGHPSSAPTDQHHSTSNGVKLERVISPPIVGPEVTLQRPSVSTPAAQQPRNSFPGGSSNPFAQDSHPRSSDAGGARGVDSGEASPGYAGTPQPTESSRPGRTFSRAAQAYTPLSQPMPQPAATPKPVQPTSRPSDGSRVLDQPTPSPDLTRGRSYSEDALGGFNKSSPSEAMSKSEFEARSRNMHAPTAIPAHVQKPIPRSVPQSSPDSTSIPRTNSRASPEPRRMSQNTYHDAATKQTRSNRPEMVQTGAGRTFSKPFMPSPDIRPPSDDSLPERSYKEFHDRVAQNENAPSMPNLVIPPPTSGGPDSNMIEDRPLRPRSPSVEDGAKPRARAPSPTPVNSHKRSVSFNPRLDFNEAPKNRHEHADDSDADSASATRRERRVRHDDEDEGRDRDRRRPRDKDRREYDNDGDHGDKDRDRKSSRRERSDTQSLDRDQDRNRERDQGRDRNRNRDRDQDRDRDRDGGRDPRDKPRRSSTMDNGSSRSKKNRDRSPASEDVEDLPERFDEKGRKKPGSYGDKSSRTADQDLLAQSLDQILGGLFGKSKK